MKYLVKFALAFILTMSFSAISYAEILVIVHPDNNAEISEKEIERMFLGKVKSFSDGKLTIPVNLAPGDETRVTFEDTVLGKSQSQMKSYWSQMIFTGKAQPIKEVSSDSEMIELVSTNPSAIGYIKADSLNDSVKSVMSY